MKLLKTCLSALVLLCFAYSAQAQCKTWNELPAADKSAAENAHVVYRGFVKNEQWEQAFDKWKTAYELAPAADGQRSFHYSDGRDIYMNMYKNETDEAKKKEYKDIIMRLYDEQIECYPTEKAFLLGRKGYDMFYTFNETYSVNLETLLAALEVGGNEVEYIVFEPAAHIAAYQYTKQLLDKEQAVVIYETINSIADYNVENNEEYGQYYDDMRLRANSKYKDIESDIFDCDYFRNKLVPVYQENPNDLDIIKRVYNKLRAQGCDESLPIMMELKTKYERMADAINEQLVAEQRANNPGIDANELYKEGNYPAAIKRYEDAIAQETDPMKKAQYHYSIASIKFRKLDQYSSARESAREAAKLRDNWGAPYMLIGDMYATSARTCGSNAYERGLAVLAAIDKYSYAKSIDPEVAGDANKRIGRMSASKPPKDDVFMMGKQGKTDRVGCWIGETVSVRY